jgi:hypothetical protein
MKKDDQKKDKKFIYVRLPLEKVEFLENLLIPKSAFIIQACHYFINHLPEDQSAIYFKAPVRKNSSTKSVNTSTSKETGEQF